MSAAAGRKWRAHPAVEQDIKRLGEDDPRLKVRAVALMDLLADGKVAAEHRTVDLSTLLKFRGGAQSGDVTRVDLRSWRVCHPRPARSVSGRVLRNDEDLIRRSWGEPGDGMTHRGLDAPA